MIDVDNNIKRTIILDNYENPFNKGLTNEEGFVKVNANNESCIDNFDLEIKMEDNVIKDIHFDGEGCAISTSATSIMLKLLIGKTKEEALNIIKEYDNMIDEKEYDESILGEAVVYSDIYKQPSRKKCALLSAKTLEKHLKETKRVNSRAIIFDNNNLVCIYRRKLKDGKMHEYYVTPGGGVEAGETKEETTIRELKEEFNVDIDIIEYVGCEEDDISISHFYKCKILNGIPKLGGEELERMNENNYYEIKNIPISDLDKYNIYGIDMIKKALNTKENI